MRKLQSSLITTSIEPVLVFSDGKTYGRYGPTQLGEDNPFIAIVALTRDELRHLEEPYRAIAATLNPAVFVLEEAYQYHFDTPFHATTVAEAFDALEKITGSYNDLTPIQQAVADRIEETTEDLLADLLYKHIEETQSRVLLRMELLQELTTIFRDVDPMHIATSGRIRPIRPSVSDETFHLFATATAASITILDANTTPLRHHEGEGYVAITAHGHPGPYQTIDIPRVGDFEWYPKPTRHHIPLYLQLLATPS